MTMQTKSRADLKPKEIAAMAQSLADGVRDYAIILLDGDGRVLAWTDAAERMIGYK
jgi:PAS domain-containing protein